MSNKYKAVWVSYSSISDYLHCPRSYFLKNVYKTPDTNKKIELTAPALSLGKAVHNTLEPLADIPAAIRLNDDLISLYENNMDKYKGKYGGFTSDAEFESYKADGADMIKNALNKPELLLKTTYTPDNDLVHSWLSKKDEIIICGKIDWINEIDNSALEVIDFKTSKREEENDLQLKIYALLLYLLNTSSVNSLYYWYLRLDKIAHPESLPDLKKAKDEILDIAKKIKRSRENNDMVCPRDGCFYCENFERIVDGDAEMVGLGEYNRQIYYLP